MMQVRITPLREKKLVGKRLQMSMQNNLTVPLWRSFMPLRKHIKNTVSNHLFSIEVYDSISFFENYSPAAPFEKWAAVEVSELATPPQDLENFILPQGLYAVFTYVGAPSQAAKAYQYIFTQWLPSSDYLLDARPHLCLMDERYKGEQADSEEEIWIPVKPKH